MQKLLPTLSDLKSALVLKWIGLKGNCEVKYSSYQACKSELCLTQVWFFHMEFRGGPAQKQVKQNKFIKVEKQKSKKKTLEKHCLKYSNNVSTLFFLNQKCTLHSCNTEENTLMKKNTYNNLFSLHISKNK